MEQVQKQKGIQCRFGARGIIAESHFDHGKNFVLMLRGRKRYLLNPPRACPVLGIISDRNHPSFRHSEIDWSDKNDWPEVNMSRWWFFPGLGRMSCGWSLWGYVVEWLHLPNQNLILGGYLQTISMLLITHVQLARSRTCCGFLHVCFFRSVCDA